MGRYRKYQAANSSSAAGLSMGSPRLVARNMSFQMAKATTPFDPAGSPFRDHRYANVQLKQQPQQQQPQDQQLRPPPVLNNVKSSPIMGRRALGPPQPLMEKHQHRRHMSDIPPQSNSEVRFDFHKLLQCIFQLPILNHFQLSHSQQQSPVSNSSSNNAGSSDNSSSIIAPNMPPPQAQINLKPVTSIQQVLYQGQQGHPQANHQYSRNHQQHPNDFDILKVTRKISFRRFQSFEIYFSFRLSPPCSIRRQRPCRCSRRSSPACPRRRRITGTVPTLETETAARPPRPTATGAAGASAKSWSRTWRSSSARGAWR